MWLVQNEKKSFSMATMGSSISSWKTMEMSEVLIWCFAMKYIYINFQPGKRPHKNSLAAAESTEFKDIPPMEHVLKWSRRPSPVSTRIILSYAMKKGASRFWVCLESQWELRTKGKLKGKVIAEQNTSVRKKEINPKEQECDNQSGIPSRKVNHLSKVCFEIEKIINRVSPGLSVPPE